MPAVIDPYYKWLGIPPAEQPPNLYRLIGVTPLEDDADVLCNAADQRMVYIRTFQLGEQSALSQKLLNEIATAKALLLNPERKKAYDDELRAKLTPSRIQNVPRPVPVSSGSVSPAATWIPPRPIASTSRPAAKAVDSRIVIAGIAAVLVVALFVLAALPATNMLGLYGKRPSSVSQVPVTQPKPGTSSGGAARPATTTVSPRAATPSVPPRATPPKADPLPPKATPIPTDPSPLSEVESLKVFEEPAVPLSPAEKIWQEFPELPDGDPAAAIKFSPVAKAALLEGNSDLLQTIVRAVAPPDSSGRKRRLKFLHDLQSQAKDFIAQRALADAATTELSQALAAADASSAREAAEIALRMARLANAPAQLKETALLASQVQGLEEIQKEGPAAVALVAAGDTSPLAMRRAGEYLCFLQGDWDHGLPWLQMCPESPWRDLAKMDVEGLDLKGQRKLGEQWWSQAADAPLCYRNEMQSRAGLWLRKSLLPSTLLALTMDQATVVREGGKTLLLAAWPSGQRGEVKGGQTLAGQVGEGLFLNLGEYVTTFVPQGNLQSIAVWMRVPRYEGTGDLFAGGTFTEGMSFTLKEGRSVRHVMGDGNGLETGQFFSNGLVDHHWHHQVFVIDHVNHQWKYFLDGELLARNPFTSQVDFKNHILFLGGGNVGFLGAFDEVAIFSHPLSPAEVQYLYQCGVAHQTLQQTLGIPKAGP